MKTFKEFINESILIFHGDNYNTVKLDPKLMNNGNNQEGIGIYFSNKLETATDYGKNVISLNINNKNFIPSRDPVKKHLKHGLVRLLTELYKIDNEAFYYFVSDYIEVYEVEDINEYHIKEMANNVENEQIRNFQIDMARNFGVVNFVRIWNLVYKNIHGTYNSNSDSEIWYCVINDKLKVSKV